MATPSAGRIIWIGVLLGIGFMIAQQLPSVFEQITNVIIAAIALFVDWLYALFVDWLYGLLHEYMAVADEPNPLRAVAELAGGVALFYAIVYWLVYCIDWLTTTINNWRRARHVATLRKHFVAEMEISLKRDE
jgi:hypothetical protein